MGGCLDKPKNKKVNHLAGTIRLPESNKVPANRQSLHESIRQEEKKIIEPKYRKITLHELFTTYRIQQTIELSSKMEGPKYVSNIVDGSSKVLRVIQPSDIVQSRLKVYKQLIGFEIYESDEGSLLLIDEFCAGDDILQLILQQAKIETHKPYLKVVAIEIVKLVQQFHKKSVWLGNLTFSSFRMASKFNPKIRLVDFNLGGSTGDHEKVGFAHKDGFEADYEFMGYMFQLFLVDQPPIFISHKMQYIEFETLPQSKLIMKLLKGLKCTIAQVESIGEEKFIISPKTALGYLFRRDINKLLKMRKKRKGHSRTFYGEDLNQILNDGKFHEQQVYRYESDRIFKRISTYIEHLKSIHEEAFLNMNSGNDSLRRLKEVFLLVGGDKKMVELKEIVSSIK